jgi:signal transduction histidine kinase
MSVEVRSGGRLKARLSGLGVGSLLALSIGVALILAAVGIGLAIAASARLSHQRSFLLDRVGPSNRAALELENALVNEETGIRGYIITVESSFLGPYGTGLRAEREALSTLQSHQQSVGAPVPDELAAVRAAVGEWHRRFVARALTEPRRTVRSGPTPDAGGKSLFDALRERLTALQGTLSSKDTSARNKLNDAADQLEALLILAAVLVLGSVIAAGLVLRRTVTRPLSALGGEARRVAGGEFAVPLHSPAGPREVRELTGEIEAMRARIVSELAVVEAGHERLEKQALELSRSNADLEQFAYVASHDLQEPLRKIASFCQALKTRYHGQLDERADQYIDFAVDGAKRMQVLINDLLSFSRVGRSGRDHVPVELGKAVGAAVEALGEAAEQSGLQVRAEGLPTVTGDEVLLASLFQNLLGNALKFRGAEPPAVSIEAKLGEDGWWELSCTDNGIGIEPEYADRIFLIFQRLHGRDVYEGSGIGLALCRKIVEYHGGRIWLDTGHAGGASFQFTLPARKEEEDR